MNFITVTIVSNLATLFFLFLSLVFTAGIVWRVEKKLDVSYKFFLSALIILLLSESMGKFFSETELFITIASVLKTVFSIFLLASIWTMRDLLRDIDGEKKRTFE